MRVLWLLAGVVFLGGCFVRTYTLEKPRVDTDISGNQGYMAGEPKGEVKATRLGETRKISVVEVEFGAHKPKDSAEKEKGLSSKENALREDKVENIDQAAPPPEETEPEKIVYRPYTIEKNDTLQSISYKFYGTTRKWRVIYEENKSLIKNPDKVYPGIKIRIPLAESSK